MGLVDELLSATPVIGAADLQSDLGISSGTYAWVVFAIPTLASAALEAGILAWSDRASPGAVLFWALLALAGTELAIASATGPVSLSAAVSAWFIASGVCTGVAMGQLAAKSAGDMAASLQRWGQASELGDLLGPVLFGALASVGIGWRGLALCGAVAAALNALAVRAVPEEVPVEDDEPDPAPLLEVARAALADRVLLGWLLASACCTFLDEILVAWGGLFLRQEVGLDGRGEAVQLAAASVGGLLGSALVERCVGRFGARRCFVAMSGVCAAALVTWVHFPTVPWIALVGASAAPMWPLAQAMAYARLPGRPGLVAALDKLTFPIELAAPLIVGWVAATWGPGAAVMALAVQPVVVAVVALLT